MSAPSPARRAGVPGVAGLAPIACLAGTLVATLAFTPTAAAQQLELPRPSPAARLMRQVGLTDISIEYSSPAVRKRRIWGGLVPYDKPWRTGANASTKVTFSKDVSIGGRTVPAGSYALLTIPATKAWTVILNKNTDLAGNMERYKPEEDVVRVTAVPRPVAHREFLSFEFSAVTEDAASLDLEWEKLQVSLPIKTFTAQQARQNIDRTLGSLWRVYANAARYMKDQKEYDAALKHIDQSLAMKEDWFNLWTKAEILAARGDKKEALALAQKADELGSKNPQGFIFAAEVKKALAEWKR
jgi:hypothetical protein